MGEDVRDENQPPVVGLRSSSGGLESVQRYECGHAGRQSASPRGTLLAGARSAAPARVGELWAHHAINNFCKLVFVGIAYNQIDSWQCRDFFRSALGVASCNHDSRIGVLTANAANRGASVLISRRCHRTGVQNYDRRLFRAGGAAQASLLELAFQSRAIGLSGAAAEIFNVIAGHISIVAQLLGVPQARCPPHRPVEIDGGARLCRKVPLLTRANSAARIVRAAYSTGASTRSSRLGADSTLSRCG